MGISVRLGAGGWGLGAWALRKLRAGGQVIRLDGRSDGRLDIWTVRRTFGYSDGNSSIGHRPLRPLPESMGYS